MEHRTIKSFEKTNTVTIIISITATIPLNIINRHMPQNNKNQLKKAYGSANHLPIVYALNEMK